TRIWLSMPAPGRISVARNPRQRRPVGARSARTSLSDRLAAWRQHHRDSLGDALSRMAAAPTAALMTVLVIAIALALPAGLAVLMDNARAITQGWDGQAHLSVFLEPDTSEDRQRALASDWDGFDTVARTEVITRAQALEE